MKNADIQRQLNIVNVNTYPLKIMAASIKNVENILNIAELGVSAITIPMTVFQDFIEDAAPTIESLRKFEHNWKSNLFMNFESIQRIN